MNANKVNVRKVSVLGLFQKESKYKPKHDIISCPFSERVKFIRLMKSKYFYLKQEIDSFTRQGNLGIHATIIRFS